MVCWNSEVFQVYLKRERSDDSGASYNLICEVRAAVLIELLSYKLRLSQTFCYSLTSLLWFCTFLLFLLFPEIQNHFRKIHHTRDGTDKKNKSRTPKSIREIDLYLSTYSFSNSLAWTNLERRPRYTSRSRSTLLLLMFSAEQSFCMKIKEKCQTIEQKSLIHKVIIEVLKLAKLEILNT